MNYWFKMELLNRYELINRLVCRNRLLRINYDFGYFCFISLLFYFFFRFILYCLILFCLFCHLYFFDFYINSVLTWNKDHDGRNKCPSRFLKL